MLKVALVVSTLSVALLACSSASTHRANIRCQARYSYSDQTKYDVNPSDVTSKNIEVDPSGLNINLSKVDRLTDEVEKCLIGTFGNPPVLPDDVVANGQCDSNTFDLPIRRECLTVKVANDWFLSKYVYAGSLHQQLPYTNGGMCTNKGLPPGVCFYRVGIQDDLTIAVPPSFYLYKDALVKIVTGCRNPWFARALAVCMEPTTAPLDDGSQP